MKFLRRAKSIILSLFSLLGPMLFLMISMSDAVHTNTIRNSTRKITSNTSVSAASAASQGRESH